VVGLILLLIKYYRWALLLIILGVLGFIWRIYESKRKIKFLSKKWANISILMIIFFVVVYQSINYFIFNRRFNMPEVVFAIGFLIIIYLYFRFYVPKAMEYRSKKKN